MTPRPTLWFSTLALLAACSGKDEAVGDTGGIDTAGSGETGDSADSGDSEGADSGDSGADSGDSGSDSGDSGDTDTGEAPAFHTAPLAGLATLSSGECPDLSASGTSTFLSSDEERKVTVLIPEAGTEGASVVFFFHGLTTPDVSPEPTVETAEALDLQTVADATNTVIILPEAPLRSLFGQSFFLWDVEGATGTDLVLYDDLRTCVADLGVDLNHVTAVGFSGGALFTTWVATRRADTLATFVSLSGGADITVPVIGSVSPYETPVWSVPGLLVSGGDADVWPDPSVPLVDFDAASDTFDADLKADGHFTVRCRHSEGHTITYKGYALTLAWMASHTYGEPSPYEESGLGSDSDWCE